MAARHIERVTGAHRRDLVEEAFASYARYWAESLRLPGLDSASLTAGMRYSGFDAVDLCLEQGQGVILALPHLGGWEWAGTQLAASGRPVSVVVERLEPPEVFEWFTAFRSRLGMEVIPAGPEAAARCSAALGAGRILCLLSDRLIAGTAGVDVVFFGESTALPAGPAALSLRTGAPLFPAAVYFEADTDRHHGLVLPALDTVRRGRIREDVRRITQDLAAAFEELIRRAPTQWHLLQPNWPSDRPSPEHGRPLLSS